MNKELNIKWINDAPLKNAPAAAGWATHGNIVQGVPRGDAAPLWWNIANKDYLKGYWWPVLTPWYVIHEGVDNKATNVRMAVHEIELWVLRAKDDKLDPVTGTWECVIAEATPTWTGHYDHWIANIIENANFRTNKGVHEYEFRNDTVMHGGTRLVDYDTTNVVSAFSRIRANLVVDDPKKPNDIDVAQYLIQIGGDYYPEAGIVVGQGKLAPSGYLPGIGGAGFRTLTTEPTWYNFATVSELDKSNLELWSPWCQSGKANYITQEQYAANPCPFGKYIPQLSLTPDELVVALLNNDNHIKYTRDEVVFSDLTSVINNDAYDTTLNVILSNPDESKVDVNDTVNLKYNRIDIHTLLGEYPITVNDAYLRPVIDSKYITDFLDKNYRLNITDGFEITYHDKSAYLMATKENVAYTGMSEILEYKSLRTRLPNIDLDGFEK